MKASSKASETVVAMEDKLHRLLRCVSLHRRASLLTLAEQNMPEDTIEKA